MEQNLNCCFRVFSLLLINFLTLSCSRSVNPEPTPTPEATSTPTPTPEAISTPMITPTPPPALPTASPLTTMPDEAGMSRADRVRVQETLLRLGYYKGNADGIFGPLTRQAILGLGSMHYACPVVCSFELEAFMLK